MGGLHWILTALWLGGLLYCLPLYRLKQLPVAQRQGFETAYRWLRNGFWLPLGVGVVHWLWNSQDSRNVVTSWGSNFQTGMLLMLAMAVNLWVLIAPYQRRAFAAKDDHEAFEAAARRVFLGARFTLVLGIAALVCLGAALVHPLGPTGGGGRQGDYWSVVVLMVALLEALAWFADDAALTRPLESSLGIWVDAVMLVGGLYAAATFIA